MRIHTDFHDYYDNSIGFGIDEKVHYNRFTKEVDIVFKTKNDRPFHRNSGLLGYCGQIYPFITLRKLDRRYRLVGEPEIKILEICYAYDYQTYIEKEDEWYEYSNDFYYYDQTTSLKIKQFYIEWRSQNDELFRELKVPIWVLNCNLGSGKNGIVNPRLKDYQFERLKDSTTAFQDISMYISNILIEQKPVATIEDKYRIQQHGFDLKESFRNTRKRKQQ